MMHIFKAIWHALGRGLNAAIVRDALALAETAAVSFVTNSSRREYVVKMLVSRGVPESVARLATEMALQLLKAKTEQPAKA